MPAGGATVQPAPFAAAGRGGQDLACSKRHRGRDADRDGIRQDPPGRRQPDRRRQGEEPPGGVPHPARRSTAMTGHVASRLAIALLMRLGPRVVRPRRRFVAGRPGGYAVLGQTFGYDCGADRPARPDHRSPAPGASMATPRRTCTGAIWPLRPRGRRRPNLGRVSLPAGAPCHARLYWGALRATPAPDREVTLDRDGGFTATVTAAANDRTPP